MKVRKFLKSDISTRVLWMNDKRIYSTMHYDLPITEAGTLKWFEKIKDDNKRVDLVFEKDNEILAMGGFTNLNDEVKKAELYIFVNPYVKNKGIGTRSVKLLCEYGFLRFSLKKIFLYVDENNFIARHVYEKVGFTQEGLMRKEVLKEGEFYDRCYYGLLKEEFTI